MESSSCLPTGLSPAQWFFLKARVALAVAIIRTRPSGTSSRGFAEALSRQLRRRQDGWKKEAQQLQQEVLRLRQELLLARATRSSEAPGPDESWIDASQDLFAPESAATHPDLHPDLHLDSDADTPDLLLPDLHPAPPPPHGGPPPGPGPAPDLNFLQTLCCLHRVKGSSQGLEALWLHPDGGADSVLVDSVCQLLDSVVSACRDHPPALGPEDQTLQACQVAAEAMELFCSQRLPSAEFSRRVEESLKELTEMMLSCNQQSKLPAAETLMKCLMTLGSSSMSKCLLIRHVLAHISALADQLWRLFQDQQSPGLDQFPVDLYQNSCRLFWMVEHLVQDSEVAFRVEVESEQSGFLRHLEQRVFLLSEEFPLFSIYMWRIGSLLRSSDQ